MAYIAGKSTTLSFNSHTVYGSESSTEQEIGEVDCTNFVSAGAYECIGDITKTTWSFTEVVNTSSLPTFVPGQTGTYSKAVSGGHTVSNSTALLLRRSLRTAPRGAYTIQCSGVCSGTVSNS